VLAFLGSTIRSIVKPGALCTFPLPRGARLFSCLYLRPWVAWAMVERRPKWTIARMGTWQRALHCAPLPNTSALRIYYPVIPM